MMTAKEAAMAEGRLRVTAHNVAYALDMLSYYVDDDDPDLARFCHMLGEQLEGAISEYERSRRDAE